MNAKLRIAPYKEMYMIRHDLTLDELLFPFLDNGLHEHFETSSNAIGKYLAPILGTPHHMVVTIENNICIASNYCIHSQMIAENTSLYKW